ncbi:MAG: DsbA family protein [Candidatus Micrarchaeota archaeon]
MVFCIVALVVFGIMGLFSASHRKLAIEAWDCVFKSATGRKCDSNFDQKMKTKISVGLLKYNKSFGNFVFKNFNALSWVLVLITIVSVLLIGIGVYNWWAFGNCNGPNSSEFCLYNAFGGGLSGQGDPSQITGKPVLENGILIGNPNAKLTIIELGCFSCPFTKRAEPFVAQALQEFDGKINVYWKSFPLSNHKYSTEAALAAYCANDQNKFLEYRQKLFENQLLFSDEGLKAFNDLAGQTGLDKPMFASCLGSGKFSGLIAQNETEGKQLNLYGTPTFFIGNRILTGPTSYDQLKNIILEQLQK